MVDGGVLESRYERPGRKVVTVTQGPSNRKVVSNFTNAEVVKELLSELGVDRSIEDQPKFYDAALVLLSAPICGTDTTRLAAFTGLPCSFIAPIRRRMIQAELWACLDQYFVAEGLLCADVSGWMCWWRRGWYCEPGMRRKASIVTDTTQFLRKGSIDPCI